MADSDVPRHKLSATGNGREPVTFLGLDEQREDCWDHGRLTSSTECVGSAAAVESSESALMISNAGQEAQGKTATKEAMKTSSSR